MGREWYLRENGSVLGPIPTADLQRAAASGRISAESEVSLDQRKWYKASSLTGLRFAARPPQSHEPVEVRTIPISPPASTDHDRGSEQEEVFSTPVNREGLSGSPRPPANPDPADSLPAPFSEEEIEARRHSAKDTAHPSRPALALGGVQLPTHPALMEFIKHSRVTAAGGLVLVLLACFLPFVSAPMLGRVSYVEYEPGYSVLVFCAAVGGLVSAGLSRAKVTLTVSALLMAVCAFDMVRFLSSKQQLLQKLGHEASMISAESPFGRFGSAIAEELVSSAGLEWGGFVVLLAGLISFLGALCELVKANQSGQQERP